MMKAGKLRHRVNIVRETHSPDGFGELIPSGETIVSTQWAEVKPLQGRELEIARQLRAETTHRITLRRGSEILPSDRITFKDRRFEILEVIDTEERGIEIRILASEIMTGGKAI